MHPVSTISQNHSKRSFKDSSLLYRPITQTYKQPRPICRLLPPPAHQAHQAHPALPYVPTSVVSLYSDASTDVPQVETPEGWHPLATPIVFERLPILPCSESLLAHPSTAIKYTHGFFEGTPSVQILAQEGDRMLDRMIEIVLEEKYHSLELLQMIVSHRSYTAQAILLYCAYTNLNVIGASKDLKFEQLVLLSLSTLQARSDHSHERRTEIPKILGRPFRGYLGVLKIPN